MSDPNPPAENSRPERRKQGEYASRDHPPGPFLLAAHLFILASLSVAQPLLDVLKKNAGLFVAERSQPIDLILLVLLLCIGVPGVLACAVWIVGSVRRGIGRALWCVLALMILVIFLLPPLKSVVPGGPGWLILGLALALGGAGVWVYFGSGMARSFLSYLAIGLPIIPYLFLASAGVRSLLLPAVSMARETTISPNASYPDIVLVVLDELPLSSLLDGDLEIDASLYPNFARLARRSIWYPEAATVAQGTFYAVPAIVTGRNPTGKILPTAKDYPDSLFNLLDGTFKVVAQESGTALCPKSVCPEVEQRSTRERMRSLLPDVLVVFGHVVLPDDLKGGLPLISQNWHDFAAAGSHPGQPSDSRTTAATVFAAFGRVMASDRIAQFRGYLDRIEPSETPTLYYLHLLLPHVPWEYLPSGKHYGVNPRVEGLTDDVWGEHPGLVDVGFQRHLLQLGLTDRLLGELLDRLEAEGMLNRSLIILVADHGVSFRPGGHRRHLEPANVKDLVSVPLFVKLPGETKPEVSSRRASTIDILPTIADALHFEVPWPVDGTSLLAGDFPERPARIAFDDEFQEFRFGSVQEAVKSQVARKLDLFEGGDPGKLAEVPDLRGTLGQPVGEIEMGPPADTTVELQDPALIRDMDLDSIYFPSYLRGRVLDTHSVADRPLALALNDVVWATTRSFVSDGAESFASVLPERAFKKGFNELVVYEVDEDGAHLSLRRMGSSGGSLKYSLQEAPDGWKLAGPAGSPAFAVDHSISGSVDVWESEPGSRYCVAKGWAADLNAGRPADKVWIVVGDRVVASARPTIERPDTAKYFGQPGILRSGFSITVPLRALEENGKAIRVLATSEQGAASELNQLGRLPDVLERRKQAGHLAEVKLPVPRGAEGGSSAATVVSRAAVQSNVANGPSRPSSDPAALPAIPPIRRGAVSGSLDVWETQPNSGRCVARGWAADLEADRPAERIWILAGDRTIATGIPTLERPNTARHFGREGILRCGFAIEVPLDSLRGSPTLRIVASSARGFASELNQLAQPPPR